MLRRIMRRVGDAMEENLATLGLWRKPIAKDGSCLFRAVSEQVNDNSLSYRQHNEPTRINWSFVYHRLCFAVMFAVALFRPN